MVGLIDIAITRIPRIPATSMAINAQEKQYCVVSSETFHNWYKNDEKKALFGILQVTPSSPHFTARSLKLAGSHRQFCFSSSENCFHVDKNLLARSAHRNWEFIWDYICLSAGNCCTCTCLQCSLKLFGWSDCSLSLCVSCVHVDLCSPALKLSGLSKMHADLCRERASRHI